MSPPAFLPSFSGEIHKLGGSNLIDAVERAQVSYIPQARTACTGFYAANLGGRAEQLISYLVDSEAESIPQLPQARAKLTLT
jgi:hypothetical protein